MPAKLTNSRSGSRPDKFVPIHFDEAGHRVATQYLLSALDGNIRSSHTHTHTHTNARTCMRMCVYMVYAHINGSEGSKMCTADVASIRAPQAAPSSSLFLARSLSCSCSRARARSRARSIMAHLRLYLWRVQRRSPEELPPYATSV